MALSKISYTCNECQHSHCHRVVLGSKIASSLDAVMTPPTHQVVQASLSGTAYVHARALSDRVQTLQHLVTFVSQSDQRQGSYSQCSWPLTCEGRWQQAANRYT